MAPPKVRSILAAVDFGTRSEEVLRQAAALAERTGAGLHVLHVAEASRPPTKEAQSEADADRLEEARRELHAFLERVVPGATPDSAEVAFGRPHEGITQRAGELSADLVVLGPNQDGDLRARFIGTTAEHVLQDADTPCLVVRSPLPLPLDRIGVTTDLSEASAGALRLAFSWAPLLAGAMASYRVLVMHAGATQDRLDDDFEEEVLRPNLEAQVAEARDAAGTAEADDPTIQIVWDNKEAEAVTKWAEREEIGLLVVGSHGQSGLKRAVLGSVATAVAREAHCPVLIVPAPEGEVGIEPRGGPET